MNEEDKELMSTWEQRAEEERQRVAAHNAKALELDERRIAVENERNVILREATQTPINGDGPTERMTTFFKLPKWQQDFRIREESIMVAARLCQGQGVEGRLFVLADAICDYIRGDESSQRE